MQSQPGRCLHSRPIPGLQPITDLTALVIVRLSVSPIPGITVHSAHSGLSVPTTHLDSRRYRED